MNTELEMMREKGKMLAFDPESTNEQRKEGINLLIEAKMKGDPEAMFIVAKLVLSRTLRVENTDPSEYALLLMTTAANKGCIQARRYVNSVCKIRYDEKFEEALKEKADGPLVDFNGKQISVARKGLLTPVDAVLEYKDGKNVLTLSANVVFPNSYEAEDFAAFEDAVIKGMLAWQGEYTVFGGQKLTVEVKITEEDRKFDNVVVVAVGDELADSISVMNQIIGAGQKKTAMDSILAYKRSFASVGFRWSARSRKIIYIQSENKKFDNYDEITHVVKHEFGHALGLGDLYKSEVDGLAGVEMGECDELDCFRITDGIYNLVMCDHHAPISNNDIEMVILAFQKNKMQLFQKQRLSGEISEALGKGN